MKEVRAFQVGTLVFPTIQEAQQQEIISLMCGEKTATDSEINAVDWMVAHTDEIVAILTCQPKSTPRKPRSDIGKKRAVKHATPAAL
jgi:hypothetical protein